MTTELLPLVRCPILAAMDLTEFDGARWLSGLPSGGFGEHVGFSSSVSDEITVNGSRNQKASLGWNVHSNLLCARG